MASKWDNVRVVTFNEDYKSKQGALLYKKGRTVAMHVRNATKLQARGAKLTMKPFDREKAIKKVLDSRE